MPNNPIRTKSDLMALDNSILDVKNNSFNYLYKAQLDMCLYRRFDFDVSDLLPAHETLGEEKVWISKYLLRIDKAFVPDQTRKLYRTDKTIFDKVLSIESICGRSDVFFYNVLIFINGELVTSPKVYCKEEFTNIIFHIYDPLTFVDSNPRFNYIDDLMKKGGKITVWFVPNFNYVRGATSKLMLVKNNGLPLNHPTLTSYVDNIHTDKAKYSAFIAPRSGVSCRRLVDSSTDIKNNIQSINISPVKSNVAVDLFSFKYVTKIVELTGTDRFFKLDRENMPIPFENMLVFTKEANDTLLYAHDIDIQMYYPNIYEIVNNTEEKSLKIFIFYRHDTASTLKYTDKVMLYEKLGGDLLQSYKDGTVIDSIKNFKVPTHRYSIEDYVESDELGKPLAYRQEKFREFFKNDEKNLTIYLKHLIKSNGNYQYIDTSKLNMEKKLRYDDKQEGGHTVFSKPCYLFIFPESESNEYKTKKYLIDGVLTHPHHRFIHEKHEFVYFKAEDFDSNTIIDIERFKTVEKCWDINFSSSEEFLEIKLPNEIAYLDNLFIVDPSTNEFLPKDAYSVSFKEYDDTYKIKEESYERLEDSKLYITNEAYFNKPLKVHIVHKAIYHAFFHRDSRVDVINGTLFNFNLTMAPDYMEHIKIYHNGRLVPKSRYKVKKTFDTYGSKFKILYTYPIERGDVIKCYYEPIERKLLDYQALINSNGIVDLRSIVKKPVDFKWYEIYINGYKLTKKTLDELTATAFAIVNLKTTKNFEIYERNLNHDDEYILDYLDKTIGSIDREIFDSMNSTQKPSIDTIYPPIEDIIDDIIKEEVNSDDEFEFGDFQNYLINKFIKPFEKQVNDEVKLFFGTLVNDKGDLTLFPHMKLKKGLNFFINPADYK